MELAFAGGKQELKTSSLLINTCRTIYNSNRKSFSSYILSPRWAGFVGLLGSMIGHLV